MRRSPSPSACSPPTRTIPAARTISIHACDDPAFAARGLEAARRYAEIAPEAEHALHMPSHIFVQLGLWPDTVASNERSWAASRKEVAALQADQRRPELPRAAVPAVRASCSWGSIAPPAAPSPWRAEVLAGVDLQTAQHVDARHAIRELAFQHAVNADDWSPRDLPRHRARTGDAAGRRVGPRAGVRDPGPLSVDHCVDAVRFVR